jgi:hypothetical protein
MKDDLQVRIDLDTAIDQLEPDALRVLEFLASRMLVGQREYGALDLKNDPRDFVKERTEEVGDLLVYTAFETLKKDLVKTSG